MEAVARLQHYRGAAQKVRLVADLIRMKPVGRALSTLRITRKRCSPAILKLVESAVANAQQKEPGLDADALVVAKVHVDEAGRKPLQRNSMLRSISAYKKRFARPRFMSGPQGRMWLIPRPFCHVTVVLTDDPAVRRKAGLPGEAPKPVARRRTGKVAAAVSKAAERPKAEKGEKAPKAPKAKAVTASKGKPAKASEES